MPYAIGLPEPNDVSENPSPEVVTEPQGRIGLLKKDGQSVCDPKSGARVPEERSRCIG